MNMETPIITRQLEAAVDCIAKHGHKYPHAAYEHFGLIKSHLERSYLRCFNDKFDVGEMQTEIHDAITSIAAEARPQLEKLIHNNKAKASPYADAKYVLHLLDRLHASPWDEENDIVLIQAKWCLEKLIRYKKTLETKGGHHLPVIHELRNATNHAKALIDSLNNNLRTQSSIDDAYNVMQTQCYLMGKLVGSVPPSMLGVFWDQFDPGIYGHDQKLESLYKETRDQIEEMHDKNYSLEEWYTAGLDLLDAATHCELGLAKYSDYTPLLRRAFKYCKRGIEFTMIELVAIIHGDNSNNKLWATRLLRRATELMDEFRQKSRSIEPMAHITLDMVGAMELCGVYCSA